MANIYIYDGVVPFGGVHFGYLEHVTIENTQ